MVVLIEACNMKISSPSRTYGDQGPRWNFEFWEAQHFDGKYRGLNGCTVGISCRTDLAQPLARIKNSQNLCSHVIFIVFFKCKIEIAGGDGINQFLLKIRAFCSCSEQKGSQFFIGGST